MSLCEYLPRLNTISVSLTFPHDIKSVTSIVPTTNSLTIIGPVSYTAKLPIDSKYTIVSVRKNQTLLVISLKIGDIKDTTNFMVNDFQWSTKDLLKTPQNSHKQNMFQFQCVKCDTTIIDSMEYRVFDMPSELWTELMDLWHCHKPAGPSVGNHKNYNGELTPKQKQIIMGSYYIKVNAIDFQKLINKDKIVCGCGNTLGVPYKLNKWNLKLVYSHVIETYPMYYYIYNLILDKINLNASRKLVVGKYLIWIFNIGLNVSFGDTKLHNTLKLCYIQWKEKPVDEEVIASDELLEKFYLELEGVYQELPEGAKRFKVKEDEEEVDYCVSYLGLRT